jgi:hypothetical protein
LAFRRFICIIVSLSAKFRCLCKENKHEQDQTSRET